MAKQYVVRMDRCDGKYPEVVLGPDSLGNCVSFIQGWWSCFKDEESTLCPEVSLFRIFIEEVIA